MSRVEGKAFDDSNRDGYSAIGRGNADLKAGEWH